MVRIDFAVGASERVAQACQTIWRQYLAGQRLVIYCPDEQRLDQVDKLLWALEDTAFVPHVRSHDPLASVTPVVLVQRELEASLGRLTTHTWLLNLAQDCPPSLGAVSRVLEIVSEDEQDKLAARARWSIYKNQGHDVRAHRLGA